LKSAKSKLMVSTLMLPRPSTVISLQTYPGDVAQVGVLDASAVGLHANQLLARDERASVREPVMAQPLLPPPRPMASLFPLGSTATISLVPQLENQRRSPCHRGDSPQAETAQEDPGRSWPVRNVRNWGKPGSPLR
jgi:hypothetical protein